MILAGRGFGKTRTGAEWVREKVKRGAGRIALIAPTAADARDIMVEGESGLLSVCWAGDRTHDGDPIGRPAYEPSKRRLTWENGAIATMFSAEEPERLRGPQHEAGWCDELAAWKHMQDTWDMFQFGLRLGNQPQACVTTTPKPKKLIRTLKKDERTIVTLGSTFDNTPNLARTFLRSVKEKYEGTRLGRQELFAELLDDVPGALWTADAFKPVREPGDLVRVVVGVDPSGASGSEDETADEIGIVVAGKRADGSLVILEDASCRLSPNGWGRRAVERYHQHQAGVIVAERNFGGAMVEAVIKTADRNAKVTLVTASRGKAVRAEPVAALYEQGRVDHMPGLEVLEQQMLHMASDGYVGDDSPDRLDAAVWALTELMEGSNYDLSGWSNAL